MLIDHWPLAGLRLTTPRLTLRLPTADESAGLADVAAAGVHPPGSSPFLTPWTDLPPAERARYVMQSHWRRLGSWSPDDWSLELVAFHEGRPVGVQEVRAADFGVRREVTTGSWLGLPYQGRGLGTEMRAAALHLAFAGLGATDATTMAFTGNTASLAVSARFGYRPDGVSRDVLRDGVVVSRRLRLPRGAWRAEAHPPVAVEGLARCLEWFGAGPR